MQRKRFSNTNRWWRYPLLAAGLVVTACSADPTATRDPELPPIMPVDAGTNEYNLINRTDPDGGPPCTVLNLCFREINDGWWEFPVDANVGTGNLNPFWDTHESPTSECFNTDAPLPLDCARSSWTNALPLNVVPVFFFDPPGADPPVLVRELVWDMNEPNSSPQTAQISIDFFRVYLCAREENPDPPPEFDPNPATFSTVEQVEGNCERVYDIEVGGVSSGVEGTGLAWDGSTQGSGSALDYRILIPEALFEAQANTESCPYDGDLENPCGLFVIVHAHLGGKGLNTTDNVNWATTGGFEEMSTVERPVPARKSGVKFNDLNANGVKDAGEPGLAGWTIFVETIAHNGILDAGEPFDVTDADGVYQINAIIAGTWRVHEVPQAGWTCSLPATTDAHGCYYEEVFEDGDVLVDNNFGNWQPGTKSGTKFEDEDADGTDDGAGEAGLAGWTINAYADTDQNGVLSAGEYAAGTAATAVTDATGAYSLTLNPGGTHAGKYIVCEVAQATWTQSAPGGTDECTGGVPTLAPDGWAITITSGSTDTGNDFGNFQNGTKSGTKFEDEDADGTDDGAGEAGLSGWTINAYADTDQNGVLSAGEYAAGAAATTSTDATGAYSLSLAPGGAHAGKYIVCEVAQATWTQSAPGGADECTGGVPTLAPDGWAITITSGSTDTGNDFGNWQPGTKSGTKFEDEDADGTDDGAGEAGLSGWTINAYADTDQNGVLSAGEYAAGAAATTVTDATGAYSLTLNPGGAHAGKYIVCEVAQATWTQSAPGGADECTGGVPTLAPDGWAITITSGSTDTGNDFGNFQGGTKSGTKYEDENANGTDDGAGEAGLSGWTINAYADGDGNGVLSAGEYAAGTAATDVTDVNGDYSLSLPPGKYIVCEVAQATWTQSEPGGADECTGGVPTLAPDGYAITVTSGSSETGNDFGNFQNGTKSGTKFEDENANGTDDGAGEAGLAGWTINAYADTDQDGVLSAGEYAAGAADTDITDATGAYSLSLAPGGAHAGKYIVCEVAQATWTQSAPGGADECTGGVPTLAPDGWAITITSGSTDTGNDFGNYQSGTKSGTKFNDLSGDGIFDGTESGLVGWTINAYADTDQNGILSAGEYAAGAAATDVTDANGDYLLTLSPGGAHAGKYIVCEVAQATWVQTAPNNTICQAGAPTLANGGWAITITSGSTDTDNDFGNFVPQVDTETAYARGDDGNVCFLDLGISNNWGWGITVTKAELSKTYEIYAGAGGCNITNATLVGHLTVSVNGQNRLVFSYDLLPGFTLESIHVWVDTDDDWPSPVSPGQFPYKSSPGTEDASIVTIPAGGPGSTYYFIAHAVVSGF